MAGLFLLGASVSALGQMAFHHDARHPDGFLITFALPESDNLGADVGQLSFVRTGNRTQQPVVVVSGTGLSPDAQASWQVREMGNVTWSVAPPAELNI